MRYVWILCLLLLSGCNTVEISSLKIKDKEVRISEYLSSSFTPEAYRQIRDIKIYEGFHFHPYVPGVNFWSDLVSVIVLNGWGRKVIASKGTLLDDQNPLNVVIHEYFHHIDDIGRDNKEELIDRLAFWEAFLRMRNNNLTRETTDDLLYRADRFITNMFGIGPLSELMAYTATWIVEHPDDCPPYMHEVFQRVLTISRSKTNLQP